jgi:hypothetical protein
MTVFFNLMSCKKWRWRKLIYDLRGDQKLLGRKTSAANNPVYLTYSFAYTVLLPDRADSTVHRVPVGAEGLHSSTTYHRSDNRPDLPSTRERDARGRERVPLHRYVYIAYVKHRELQLWDTTYAQQTIGRVIGHWPYYTGVDKTQRHRYDMPEKRQPALSLRRSKTTAATY